MVFILKFLGAFIFILLISLSFYWIKGPSYIIKYIANNPLNGSIFLVKNNKVILDKNSNYYFPLASVVKIIIAIEFVKQISSQNLDKDELIDLNEVNKYYIDEFIGGTHKYWLEYIQKEKMVKENKISLYEIAKGMIEFSSNANTEYLINRLGIQNINKVLDDFCLKEHESIYPFISSVLLIKKLSLEELGFISKEKYIELSHKIHEKLKNDAIDKNILKKDFPKQKMKFFSDFFIRGTTKEYISILDKLNNRDYFSSKEYEYFDYIMAPSFTSKDMVYEGFKGGSTSSILNIAYYGTHKDGTKIELVIFLNNLTYFEYLFFYLPLFKIESDVWDDNKIRKYQQILDSYS